MLKEVEKDPELQKIIEAVKKNPKENTKYQWKNDRLLYHGRLVISKHSLLLPHSYILSITPYWEDFPSS